MGLVLGYHTYQRIRRRPAWILGLADILDVPRTSQGWYTQAGVEVAQEVEPFLHGLAALKCEYAQDAPFIEHIIQRTEDWAPGLFFCYEEPALPRTNNDLEQYHTPWLITGRPSLDHQDVPADKFSRMTVSTASRSVSVEG